MARRGEDLVDLGLGRGWGRADLVGHPPRDATPSSRGCSVRMSFMPSAPGHDWWRGARLPQVRHEASPAPMEAGLRGPDGDVEDAGGLGERQVEVEVQDHHGPLVDRQRPSSRPSRSRSAIETTRSNEPAGSGSGSTCSSTRSRRRFLARPTGSRRAR